jgi:pyruvate dehydrogenase E2 component (dihydrolipoamide acetyltransferase)
MRRLEVRLPEVGDAKEITVVEVAVAAGAHVERDDLLLVVESDKASMEVPAPVAGRVVDVAVTTGASVAEGDLLVVIESAAADAQAPAVEPSPPPPERPRAESTRAAAPPPRPTATATAAVAEPRATPAARIYAGPAVRRMARELGVDLGRVTGTGARGRIVKEDVQAHVKARLSAPPESHAASAGIPAVAVIDFAKFGPVETVALSRIRRRGAANLHRSWLNVVHVTQHDEADVTELEAFRASLKAEAGTRGVKLTPLPFILRALVPVLRAFPAFNASLDANVENLILKRYIHIGFAVDTPEGLVVPVVRDVDQKGVWTLAAEIETLSAKARDGKLAPADLSGGSFSVSSLGAIGGTGFTPIVNAPEVAILGVSRLATKPFWNGTAFVPRQFLPVSLSYDHRAINGAEAGRFVAAFCSTLADMRRALL